LRARGKVPGQAVIDPEFVVGIPVLINTTPS